MSHFIGSSLILAHAIPIGGALLRNLQFLSISSLLVGLSGALIFGGACYLVLTKRRPAVLAAFLVFLPLPLLIAFWGLIWGHINVLLVIESTGIVLTTEQLAGGYAAAMTEIFFALLVSAPTYFLLAFGLLARTLNPPTDSNIPRSVRLPSREPLINPVGPKPVTN